MSTTKNTYKNDENDDDDVDDYSLQSPSSLPSSQNSPEGGVALIGSLNFDRTFTVESFIKEGETKHMKKYEEHPGGKGNNQAIMCGKLSMDPSRCIFVGCVGNDKEGVYLKDNLKRLQFSGVDKHIKVIGKDAKGNKVSTGMAMIEVEKSSGKNRILLNYGANEMLSKEHIDESWEDIKKCKVLVCQLEVPLEPVMYALQRAKKEGILTILNPSPSRKDFPEELFKYVDILCPNEHEAEDITGVAVKTKEDAKEACIKIVEKGVETVIITLGDEGYVLYEASTKQFEAFEAVPVSNVVDTTGAGDAFLGSFSYFKSCDISNNDCAQLANFVSSFTVQETGASASYENISRSSIFGVFGSLMDEY